jgi:glutamate synthase (NADPH/NADH) small chain
VSTKTLIGTDGKVARLLGVVVEWDQVDGRWQMSEVSGSEFELQADLVLLAMGFVSPVHDGLVEQLAIATDQRGNVAADTGDFATTVSGVFAAGDMRRGQSLVVWAIKEGRQCARAVDQFLMGHSDLPR